MNYVGAKMMQSCCMACAGMAQPSVVDL